MWWKYVTDIDNKTKPDLTYKDKACQLRKIRTALQNMKDKGFTNLLGPYIEGLKTDLESLGLPPKSSVLPEYFQQRDPTLFISGAQSGWPVNYLHDLRVRLDAQILGYEDLDDEYRSDSENKTLEERDQKFGVQCLPEDLKSTARALIREFISFIPGSTVDDPNSDEHVPPLYHDQGHLELTPPTSGPWRDRWESTQPWFPLFIEWEADYYDIALEYWKFGKDTNRGNQAPRYMYSIAKDVVVQNLVKDPADWDRRTVSGRILLLPQPTFSLRAELEQLFNSTPKSVLDSILPEPNRTNLLAGIADFPFLSAPLDGFTNHLLTRAQGSHIKPNVRLSVPGETNQTVVLLEEAWKFKDEDGELDAKFPMTRHDINDIGIESEVTPYGSLVQVQYSNSEGKPFCNPFKPVTHGQFHFTKINIIDKFGQCAPAIDQTPNLKGRPAIYPCISDYYQPENYQDSKGNNVANVVAPALNPKNNEWVQILPTVNQPGRLNFNFVTQIEKPTDPAY